MPRIVMAYVAVAYIVMAYVDMALCGDGVHQLRDRDDAACQLRADEQRAEGRGPRLRLFLFFFNIMDHYVPLVFGRRTPRAAVFASP